ncbi:Rne/Rng family ribonuclease [Bradyrhizobium sp. HKCCYLS1011]|uniref:Rne/Rng family ribonuclease n=1 Tax=Bradyrhizobium sp. HKCCYLS1011 TaxID=3420733 RepID=UPI003EBC2E47
MPNKMLIDATHPEETRVVVVRGNRVEEFDFETAQRKQLRGNIYLAKVTRVEPSLQAAFVEYGGNRHGFLAFSEIHPDYYQIPVADRQALIEAEERAHREAEEENESRANRRRNRHRSSRRRGSGERVQSEIVEGTEAAAAMPQAEGHEPEEHHLESHDVEPHDLEPHAHEPEGDRFEAHHEGYGEDDDAESDRVQGFGEAGLHQAREVDEHHAGDDHHHDDDHDHDEDDDHPDDDVHDEEHDERWHAAGSAVAERAEGEAPSDIPVVGSENLTMAPGAEHHEADAAGEYGAERADLHDHDDHVHDEHTAADTEQVHEGSGVSIVPQDENGVARGDDHHDDEDEDGEEAEEEVVESVGGDDVLEEVPERPFRPRRQYKIQEVIKRRQVMLVQVVKEERGNKGAALTTYLSLAGRYAVLMPNTARGGGISRKITSAQDRSRLKEVVQDLDVPEGMGVILRTAGANRTKPEIKRDFEYLLRLWETVRDMTLKSQAPTLVYEEGSLIKRSLRDLYNKEIDEILVAGEAGYREAHDFMKMLMPSNVRAVKQYRDGQPLFSRMGVESQLDAMFSPTVQLRSGGYIVINQTEALVSIDVNSGRATREHHIEDTALKTNLEAAEEVARQLRLRDLAGLIVIDFIDMDEKRNNRAVERKLSDCLRQDRARIQVGRISHFGLLEMSRQRIRASVLESSTEPCPQCGGTGHVRSVSSVALQLLRSLEEVLMRGATHNLVVRTRTEVALYVLNHKRGHLRDLENSFKVSLAVIADPTVSGQQAFVIDRGEQVHTLEAAKALVAAQASAPALVADDVEDEDEPFDLETESEVETDETEGLSDETTADGANGEGEREGPRRRRRRRRRGRGGEAREGAQPEGAVAAHPSEAGQAADLTAEDAETDDEDADEQPAFAHGEPQGDQPNGERRPRRRGRRGGRRRRGGADDGLAASIADDLAPPAASEVETAVADFDGNGGALHQEAPGEPDSASSEATAGATDHEPVASAPVPAPQPVVTQEAEQEEPQRAESDKTPRRSTVREKVSFFTQPKQDAPAPMVDVGASEPSSPPPAPAAEPQATEAATAPSETPGPRRAGWWSRRFGGGQ